MLLKRDRRLLLKHLELRRGCGEVNGVFGV